ncbi:MAG: CPBP family intramembrane metalloprotease [Thermoplasmata archaeon]|nr:CPBP family intramembrane metalloprotease [Thermoplasmata archaeon]
MIWRSLADVPTDVVTHRRYVAAVAITVLAIASQYFLPQVFPALDPLYNSLLTGVLIVYGIPILAFLLLVGAGPLQGWKDQMLEAGIQGLRWYGVLSLLAIFLAVLVVIVLTAIGENPASALQRETPVIKAAVMDPWFWVAFSFVIGAVEETIFRGWIYGYWRSHPDGGGWTAVLGTSLLFAGVHAYYATTYGPIAIIAFLELFLIGAAFAQTVRMTGGNLVIVALLHGANDATAFYTLINPTGGTGLHLAIILVGALIALILYLRAQGPPHVPFA